MLKDTKKTYSFLWKRHQITPPSGKGHFNAMQEVIGEPIVRGSKGIDVGCGCGYDAYLMAKDNPSVEILGIDLSDGVYRAKELTSKLKNVRVVKSSVLDMPVKDNVFDFAYSFGVLHHTPDPERGLSEITRVLKKQSPVYVYLYEDHSGNPLKHIAVKITSLLRKITIKIPSKILYILACVFSPLVFILFSIPSKILKWFKATEDFAKKMPFNFGTHPFSLCGDLYDRFKAPIERRFSRQGVYDLFKKCGLLDIKITRLQDSAGWVAWGYKG